MAWVVGLPLSGVESRYRMITGQWIDMRLPGDVPLVCQRQSRVARRNPPFQFRIRRRILEAALGIGLSSLMAACAPLQKAPVPRSSTANAFVSTEPLAPPRRRGKTSRSYRIRGKTYRPMLSSKGYREVGIASWYGFESGRRTATGERFNPNGLSAAHKTLPLPTRVRVTNLANGRSTVLIVNDRGPFVQGRLIDLSMGAAKRLDIYRRGSGKVLVEALN